MGLPATSFAGVDSEVITGLGEEPEGDSDGSGGVLVPLFDFLGIGGGVNAFFGNKITFINK